MRWLYGMDLSAKARDSAGLRIRFIKRSAIFFCVSESDVQFFCSMFLQFKHECV